MYLLFLGGHFLIVLFLSLINVERSNRRIKSFILLAMIILFCVLIALRPDNIVPDVKDYRIRYETGYRYITFHQVLLTPLFGKTPIYYMNVLPSLLAYLGASSGVSFPLFSFFVAFVEISIVYNSFRGIMTRWRVDYNAFLLLLFCMSLYGYHYQFIAYAQGLAMMFIYAGFSLWVGGRRILATILLMCAVLCHAAGIVGFGVVFIYVFIQVFKKDTYKLVWGCCIIALLTGAGFAFGSFVQRIVASVVNVAQTYYSEYASYNGIIVTGRTSYASVVLCMLSGFLVVATEKRKEYWKTMNIFLVSMIMTAFFVTWPIISRLSEVILAFSILLFFIFIKDKAMSIRLPDGTRIKIKDGEKLVAVLFCMMVTLSKFNIFTSYYFLNR